MFWVGREPVSWKQNKKEVHWRFRISLSMYILAVPLLSLSLHYFVHFLIKRKKEADIILLVNVVVSF